MTRGVRKYATAAEWKTDRAAKRKAAKPPSADRIREVLDYDSSTGVFRWKVRLSPKHRIGSVAGSPDTLGYLCVQIDHYHFRLHQAAWLYVHGVWPEEEIDHKDRKADNNAIANLRFSGRKGQRANSSLSTLNTSGFKGVTWKKRRGAWVAQIGVDGKHIHLGQFKNKEDAAAAYRAAAKSYFGEFANS